ncbi:MULTISPECIES: hypothetical protein [Paenibacillaceae]|uniref:Uncharacterized protein n=2 Tax=Paenibacillaceae TaxID=186822 RepID=A0A511VB23_9BACL|nr:MULTISPECIES: hypothetical protein [Paenibacillaceae]MUG72722.1 hypothetical protein [Paenibacillus validus]GEN36136.1 hypothetical protein ADA01nite_35960 [Aneurinibacillus danicus]
MEMKCVRERIVRHVGDILQSPSIFRLMHEEYLAEGYTADLLPGCVILRLEDGEIHFAWKNGMIVERVYSYRAQQHAG